MGKLVCFYDPESYVGGSSSPGRFNQAEQVKGEGPDECSETNQPLFLRVVEVSLAFIDKQIFWFWDNVSFKSHRPN